MLSSAQPACAREVKLHQICRKISLCSLFQHSGFKMSLDLDSQFFPELKEGADIYHKT